MYTGYITREEFGVNLFETIKTISGIHAMRQQMNAAVHRERADQVAGLTTRYNDARGVLAKQLPTLTDHEMAEVLCRYPWVVGV